MLICYDKRRRVISVDTVATTMRSERSEENESF